MENLTEEIKKLSEKIDQLQHESIFDRIIKFIEKIILPVAVIFLSYQSIELTKRLESAQNSIANASLKETIAENERSEKESLRQLEMNYVNIIYSDLTSNKQERIESAIGLVEILGHDFATKFTKLSSKLDIPQKSKEALKTIARDKIDSKQREDDKKSEILIAQFESSSSSENGSEEILETEIKQIETENNNILNSRIETYSRNEKVIKALSDQNFSGNRESLKNEFWDLYWGDMVKYENSEIESLMVMFGKEIKSQTPDFESLNTIKSDLLIAMNKQTNSNNWVKEGYYRSHDNFRISLISLDTKNKVANYKIKTTDNQTIAEKSLKLGEVLTFEFEGINYELKLNSIDNAGKNPFTKASYYTIKDSK